MNSVGHRLREARLARGLTQEQLARGLATKGFISQVERERASPSLAKLRLFAERLSLPISELTGEPAPSELAYLRKSATLALKAGEPERALALVEEAEPLARTAAERADLLRIRGAAFDALHHLPDALDAHQRAAALAPADEPELSGLIYAEIATVLNQLERFNAGLEAGLRALAWLERSRHSDPAVRSRVLSNLGRSSYGLGQLPRSHGFYQQALTAATDSESLYRIANAHMALGVTARAKGSLEDAVEHCNRALQIWERIHQARAANRVMNNLGDVFWSMGKKTQARAAQQQCLERARELGDLFAIGVSAGELARYALEAGDAPQAIRLARESQEAAGRDGDHLHQAYAVAVEASATERLGKRRLADRKYREAFRLLIDREAGGKLAEVCSMYAEALRHRGQQDRAFALMKVAAERDFNRLRAIIGPRG